MAIGRGRPPVKPSVDDPEAIGRLCEYLVSGLSMRKACEHRDAPPQTAVYIKMAKDEDFRAVIARAREAQQAALVDQMTDMADGATAENWQVVRMQIWARQWTAAKLASKIYGDKIQHAGADGTGPVVHRIERVIVDPKD